MRFAIVLFAIAMPFRKMKLFKEIDSNFSEHRLFRKSHKIVGNSSSFSPKNLAVVRTDIIIAFYGEELISD